MDIPIAGDRLGSGSGREQALFYIALLLVSAALVLPAAIRPISLHDDFWIAWVWADQFGAAFWSGDLYPRWLAQSHGGLGSPVFYFYPPLSFYVAALFQGVGLDTHQSLVATYAAGFFASGATMRLFLRELGAERASLGALLYVVLPYHLIDFLVRGALAEHLSYAWIPLVGLGLVRAVRGQRCLVLGIAVAGLILTHLPLAMLVCIFLVAPVLAVIAYRSPARLLAPVAALAVGILVSAIYLLPALVLEPARDASALWSRPGLKPAAWSIWKMGTFGPEPGLHLILVIVCACLALPAMLVRSRRLPAMPFFALFCLGMALAVVPQLWSLPLLEKAQFPFRIIPLAEFAVCATIACASGRLIVGLLTFTPALAVSALILTTPPPPLPPGISPELVRQKHPDVPENLPPGNHPRSWPSWWALDLAERPIASAPAGWSIVKTFHFPSWTVRCGDRPAESMPDPATGLIAYRGRGCRLVQTHTWPELAGGAISLVGLVALLAWAAFGRSGGRRSGTPKP